MMTEMYEKIDYKALQQKTLEQFKADNSLVGKKWRFCTVNQTAFRNRVGGRAGRAYRQ